jgi:Hemolysin activation/secretion protein
MKKFIIIAATMFASAITSFAAQPEEIKKTGWNFGPLPCVGYNSDLGFQYGVCADIFHYKDIFPDYRQRFYVEASRYTKGQTLLHAQMDSKYIIPGVRLTCSVSYQLDPLFLFYGLDGLEMYDGTLDLNKDTRTAYYNYKRSMVRVMADIQKPLAKNLDLLGGIAYWDYKLGDIENDNYDSFRTLYHKMRAANVFTESEAEGGRRFEFKVGLHYDSRENESDPSYGINSEVYLNGSPDFFGDHFNYLRLVAHWRQYLSLAPNRLVFAYHLAWQGTVAGNAPFYTQQNLSTYYLRQTNTDGLGGINSVRGIFSQRLVGSDYAWANVELRLRLFSFNFINQSWYVAINPFFDAGMVTSMYKGEELSSFYGKSIAELRSAALKPHCGAGAGLKLAMNRNFIVSVEDGMPLKKTDGKNSLYISLNYTF